MVWKKKKFYISELNKLKRDGIEERLVTERLEELKIVDSPYQDPFEPIKPSKSLKVAKTTLIILSITLIILLLAILTPFYGAAEDIIKDIISQPIGMWISAYPGVSILIFLGTGIILGFLIWLLEWLKNKF